MERLTEWNKSSHKHAYYPRCFKEPCYGSGCKIEDCPFEIAACERLADYEDTGLTPEEIKAPFTEDTMINLAAQALGVEPSRLRELAEADKDGRVVVLPPEERTLDFPAKYTEIRALYHFCVDLGIKCTIEHLYDGYAVRFPDGSDFAQHYGTYGGTEGCVEPAIGDSEFDYTAVGLNLAKELVKKHKGKLEANHV